MQRHVHIAQKVSKSDKKAYIDCLRFQVWSPICLFTHHLGITIIPSRYIFARSNIDCILERVEVCVLPQASGEQANSALTSQRALPKHFWDT